MCYEHNAYLVLKNTQKLKQKEIETTTISTQFSTIDELHELAISKLKELDSQINTINSNNSNLVSDNKSSLPNENLNQENTDLDDEIPF